ncbi:MAG: methyltransferase [Candidatus Woesearchaeota archaeon]
MVLIFEDFDTIIEQLSRSEGHDAAKLMRKATSTIDTCEHEMGNASEIESFLLKALPHITEKRKGSISFLIGYAGLNLEMSIKLLEHRNPIIREGIVKGLVARPQEHHLPHLKERLEKEDSLRIKKQLIYALANMGLTSSRELLEDHTPEPELFLDYSKALGKEHELNNSLPKTTCPLVIHTVEGMESVWMNNYVLSGKLLGNGMIHLEKKNRLKDFLVYRDVYGVGVYLGTIDEAVKRLVLYYDVLPSYRIQFTNTIKREKTILSRLAAALAENGSNFNPKSKAALHLIDEEHVMLYYQSPEKPLTKLPASINTVVASMISLLAPEATENVLDPCCGAATLLIEHHHRHPGTRLRGFDTSEKALVIARKNAWSVMADIALEQNDATKTGLSESSVERIVTNPPFGKRVKHKNINKLYEGILHEAHRILKEDGVAIIYTEQKKLLERTAEKAGFRITGRYDLKLPKSTPSVYVLKNQDS